MAIPARRDHAPGKTDRSPVSAAGFRATLDAAAVPIG
jgi:hypothetical protein